MEQAKQVANKATQVGAVSRPLVETSINREAAAARKARSHMAWTIEEVTKAEAVLAGKRKEMEKNNNGSRGG